MVGVSQRDIEPNETGMLAVGDGHQVYWETWGNPDGVPVVFLHGGPGGGCWPGHRDLFDPVRHFVVFFDQRGCGRSRPLASEADADLSVNTTRHLIADMEQIRRLVGVDRWVVYGLSWGSTLGLAYAETHPDRVAGAMLGLFGPGTRQQVRWITEGVAPIFAPQWERFASHVPDRLDGLTLVEAYNRLLFDPDPDVQTAAALEWCIWEDAHMSLAPGSEPRLQHEDPSFQLLFARLVTHYWSNGCFLGETELVDNAHRLDGIPGVMVQGKFDISSPIEGPWRVSRSWSGVELVVVDDAGHGGGSLTEALSAGLERATS
jgi:proline iminopeptidase